MDYGLWLDRPNEQSVSFCGRKRSIIVVIRSTSNIFSVVFFVDEDFQPCIASPGPIGVVAYRPRNTPAPLLLDRSLFSQPPLIRMVTAESTSKAQREQNQRRR